MAGDEWVEFEDVTCTRSTDAALLCQIDGEEVWIPRSQVDRLESEVTDRGHTGTLVVKAWLAREKGLI